MHIAEKLGRWLARYLDTPRPEAASYTTSNPQQLAACIRKGDVLLVDGASRISSAVKYLTQSTWSHAALCIEASNKPDQVMLLEADVQQGVHSVGIDKYWQQHTRICRPVGLNQDKIDALVDYAKSRIGDQYDLKNIFDLARYLIQTPPVPNNWKRRMLALGSGDPTRAICSSLIAQAFQSVRYPILPHIEQQATDEPACNLCYREILHIRHHSLYAPRDFDISPYFKVIKPSIEQGFDPQALTWGTSIGNHAGEKVTV